MNSFNKTESDKSGSGVESFTPVISAEIERLWGNAPPNVQRIVNVFTKNALKKQLACSTFSKVFDSGTVSETPAELIAVVRAELGVPAPRSPKPTELMIGKSLMSSRPTLQIDEKTIETLTAGPIHWSVEGSQRAYLGQGNLNSYNFTTTYKKTSDGKLVQITSLTNDKENNVSHIQVLG